MAGRDALLLVDCIQTFDFEGADALLDPYLALAAPLAALRQRARAAGAPIVWVNDHFGEWRCTWPELVAQARQGPAGPFLDQLSPEDGEHHVLKPRHSAFFQTPLESLLRKLEVKRLILCGVQAHSCVLFTAHDAHMWEYEVAVPEDGVASERPEDVQAALHVVHRVMRADTRPCARIAFGRS